MKRKSKGQMAREEKVTQREQKAIDSMLNDKWFMGLPSLVQLRLVSFMKDKVDLQLNATAYVVQANGFKTVGDAWTSLSAKEGT